MKKHLIAAAVAAAIAVPAAAQVTVYGIIETGLMNTDNVDGTADTTTLANSTINSSRLGFRGTEDLGGGLTASFRLESTVAASNGTLGGGATVASDTFDRGAEIGLSGSFGSFRMGKFDVGTENTDSSMSQFGNWGNHIRGEIGSDMNGSISYQTPSIGGFSVRIGHGMDDSNDSDGAAGTTNLGEVSEVFVSGNVQGFKVEVGHLSSKPNVAAGTTGVATDLTAFGISGSVGFATVGFSYLNVDTGAAATEIDAYVLSARVPLGGGLSAHAMVGSHETGTTQEEDRVAVGVSKDFSKRTTGYLAYRDTDLSGANSGNGNTRETYLGVVHRF